MKGRPPGRGVGEEARWENPSLDSGAFLWIVGGLLHANGA